MSKQIIHGDLNLCFDMANAFLDIGEYCDDLDKQAQAKGILFKNEAFYAFPAIVNLSFACELYLKALILRQHREDVKQTHNLMELYNVLPANIHDELEVEFRKYTKRVSFKKTIEIHASAFENWRYGFEPEKSQIEAYPENLQFAAKVLKIAIEENWMVRLSDSKIR